MLFFPSSNYMINVKAFNVKVNTALAAIFHPRIWTICWRVICFIWKKKKTALFIPRRNFVVQFCFIAWTSIQHTANHSFFFLCRRWVMHIFHKSHRLLDRNYVDNSCYLILDRIFCLKKNFFAWIDQCFLLIFYASWLHTQKSTSFQANVVQVSVIITWR